MGCGEQFAVYFPMYLGRARLGRVLRPASQQGSARSSILSASACLSLSLPLRMPLSLPRGLPLSEGCRVSAASLATEGAARTLFGRDDFL